MAFGMIRLISANLQNATFSTDQVIAVLKNVLLRSQQRTRGQCYDGAATKEGEKTGVATQLKTINGKCFTCIVKDMPEIWLSMMP